MKYPTCGEVSASRLLLRQPLGKKGAADSRLLHGELSGNFIGRFAAEQGLGATTASLPPCSQSHSPACCRTRIVAARVKWDKAPPSGLTSNVAFVICKSGRPKYRWHWCHKQLGCEQRCGKGRGWRPSNTKSRHCYWFRTQRWTSEARQTIKTLRCRPWKLTTRPTSSHKTQDPDAPGVVVATDTESPSAQGDVCASSASLHLPG